MDRQIKVKEAPLDLDFSDITTPKTNTLAVQARNNREIARIQGEESDRQRIIKSLNEIDVEAEMTAAMARGKSSFTIDLGYSYQRTTSELWDPKEPIAKSVMRELNQSLLSSTALTKASYNIVPWKDIPGDYDLLEAISRHYTIPTAMLSIGYAVGLGIAASAAIAVAPFGVVTAAPIIGAATYAWLKSTISTSRAFRAFKGNLYNEREIEIHFKNPNKPWIGIPGRAVSALSMGVAQVKETILARFGPSSEQQSELRKTFSENFRTAVQEVSDNYTKLERKAVSKGLNFEVDIDRFIELSNKQIEIVEESRNGRAYTNERRTLFTVTDLAAAMKQASNMTTLEQKDLTELATSFQQVSTVVEANVRKEESKQAMNALTDVSVGVGRLTR